MPPRRLIPVRMDDDMISELDKLAEALTEAAQGAPVSRSDAVRIALRRGINVLREEMGIAGAEHRERRKRKGRRKK